MAVLTIPVTGEVRPVRFGRVAEHDEVLRCGAIGFPRFKLRSGLDGSSYRDVEHVRATCSVLSNRREGTLDLRVAAPADSVDSPWEGMSGAAVLSGDLIIGIIAQHHRADGPGRLAARRVDRWSELLTEDERHQLEELLGAGLASDVLPDAIPPAVPDLVVAAYAAETADLAPDRLVGREDELHRLAEFCAGTSQYLWIQGPPWAGKTALVAWFASHPPSGVVPVCFFVTSRLAGHADSVAYDDAIFYQLAVIAGRDPARRLSAAARDAELRLLMREAAERVARDGATLLLVVDGLDEDQAVRSGGKGPSISALLPERPPPNVRVLVTSRSHPGVPVDVKGDHPLRHCPVWILETAAAARHTEHEARYDLHVALSGDVRDRDLLGLLAAALGGLTLGDLHELVERPEPAIGQRLRAGLGRVVRERAVSLDGYVHADERGYSFAHETLLVAALEELGPSIDLYRERIHAWAARYADHGWPPTTPTYLLQPYGRMIVAVADLGRAAALATDLRRHDHMRMITGSDSAGLAEIDMVHKTDDVDDSDDLQLHAALGAAADLMARRNRLLPPAVPIAVAKVGQLSRAIGLARSVYDVAHRAHALASVAEVLAQRGDPHAVTLARDALGLAEWVETHVDDFTPSTDDAVRMAMVALMTAGERDEVMSLLNEPLNGDAVVRVEHRAAVAVAAHRRDPDLSAELLGEAESVAGALSELEDRVVALAGVARAYAVLDPDRSARIYTRLTRTPSRSPVPALFAVVSALREVDPSKAARFAARVQSEVTYLGAGPLPIR